MDKMHLINDCSIFLSCNPHTRGNFTLHTYVLESSSFRRNNNHSASFSVFVALSLTFQVIYSLKATINLKQHYIEKILNNINMVDLTEGRVGAGAKHLLTRCRDNALVLLLEKIVTYKLHRDRGTGF